MLAALSRDAATEPNLGLAMAKGGRMRLEIQPKHTGGTPVPLSNDTIGLFADAELIILKPMYRTQDLHVKEIVPLLSPRTLKALSPTPVAINDAVAQARERVIRILRQEDPRMLVVMGPCSIHDEKSALEYATRLSKLQKEVADKMEIVMRVYFEKDRKSVV